MVRRLPWLLGTVETYLLLLIAWYVLFLTVSLPRPSSIGVAISAIALFALLAGAGWTTAHLDRGALGGTIARVTALFLGSALAAMLSFTTMGLPVEQFLRQSLAGRILVSLAGAAFLVDMTMALVAGVQSLWRRGSSTGAGR